MINKMKLSRYLFICLTLVTPTQKLVNSSKQSNHLLDMKDIDRINDLPKAGLIDGRFTNPWSTWAMPSFWNILKFMREKNRSNVPDDKTLDITLPIVKPDFDFKNDEMSITWIGHSTTLIHMDGITILTDPIFSQRASPTQMIGPARYRRAAVSIEELPTIDAVVISHNHFDHLDLGSVEALNARFGSNIHWLVPLGLKAWMEEVGCSNVTELNWWSHSCIDSKPGIRFVFTPAQHWTRRGLNDERKVLWGSWTVIGPKRRFFFAGDTGYCTVFKQIGQMYGPFDISAIPIGAYEPRWMMSPQHVDPKEAVQIHTDIKSQLSVAIHWGTFALAHEYYLDPPEVLRNTLKEQNLDSNQFITLSHGQTKTL